MEAHMIILAEILSLVFILGLLLAFGMFPVEKLTQ